MVEIPFYERVDERPFSASAAGLRRAAVPLGEMPVEVASVPDVHAADRAQPPNRLTGVVPVLAAGRVNRYPGHRPSSLEEVGHPLGEAGRERESPFPATALLDTGALSVASGRGRAFTTVRSGAAFRVRRARADLSARLWK